MQDTNKVVITDHPREGNLRELQRLRLFLQDLFVIAGGSGWKEIAHVTLGTLINGCAVEFAS
jgi:hypothetical protein